MTKLISHTKADYRAATTTEKRCANCTMFVAGKTPSCTLVERPIRPSDVCNYFKPKEGRHHAAA